MGAPTWPPTPEDADRATLAEYGDQARAVIAGAESDEEAEQALLSWLLLREPGRQLSTGEEVGTPLSEMSRGLEAWLRMVTGLDFDIAASDPPATDGRDLYLPRAAPSPRQPAADRLLYRVMGLVQLGLVRFGLLDNRPFLAEAHRDWVLRSVWHLLAARWVLAAWVREWPGLARDIAGARELEKAGRMRVNVAFVPRRGMPEAFLPLYDGLVGMLEVAGPLGDPARAAVAAIDKTTDPRAAGVVILGHAQRLRQHFLRLRLGPPPLPWFLGVLRPEWLLHDIAAEHRAAEAWRQGPAPLRVLRDALERKGGSRVPGRLRRLMRAGGEGDSPTRLEHAMEASAAPAPERDDSVEYDEWDATRGVYRVGHTRVVEVVPTANSTRGWDQAIEASGHDVQTVRRRFSALRLERRWLHGQSEGPVIDLDRAIAAVADIRAGYSPREDWFSRFQHDRRPAGILVMTDVSGSTQGDVIRLERQALALVSEGLDALGWPHALWAFSNRGPRECTVQVLKGWAEQTGPDVQRRVGGLRPGGATRLGAFLRHGCARLSRRPEGRRVLLLISDGRPHCAGDYRDAQAVADAAMAVREAVGAGVRPFCVSMDRQGDAEDYLRAIFGPGRYLLLDRPDQLPTRLPDALRKLVSA